MAGKELPFDEDVMTLIMGLGGHDEPGQHGRKVVPTPGDDIVDTLTQIRDLCEACLMKVGKGSSEEKPEKRDMEEEAAEEVEL